MLALSNAELAQKLVDMKQQMKEAVAKKDANLQKLVAEL